MSRICDEQNYYVSDIVGFACGASLQVANYGSPLANEGLPLLEANFAACHAEMALGGLQATKYEALIAGGQSGAVVVPGSPEESLIVTKMGGAHPAVLAEDDLQTLIDWIAAGAADN